MLKQLAPIAVMPPSPKNSAWSTSATDVVITAAHGPSTIAVSVPPTPWAVVPPGTGTLNIMIAKVKAEKIASSGTVRPLSASAHPLGGDDPERRRGHVHDAARRGAEIAVRYVHVPPPVTVLGFVCGTGRRGRRCRNGPGPP